MKKISNMKTYTDQNKDIRTRKENREMIFEWIIILIPILHSFLHLTLRDQWRSYHQNSTFFIFNELYKTVQDFWFYVFQQKLEHIPVKGITTT